MKINGDWKIAVVWLLAVLFGLAFWRWVFWGLL